MTIESLSWVETSAPFLQYIHDWQNQLAAQPLGALLSHPERAAILSVDLIRGFCSEGALASDRVQGIVAQVCALMTHAWQAGVRNVVLLQDAHDPQAVEFGAWLPHCVRGTSEAETVPELRALPFFDQMTLFEKNSVASGINTGLAAWIAARPQVDTFVVVGDCTDLCIYQLATYLRMDADARQLRRRVIVPANCVQTYDYPVEIAQSQGGMPHPGNLMHAFFLYHLALNGVEIVSEIYAE